MLLVLLIVVPPDGDERKWCKVTSDECQEDGWGYCDLDAQSEEQLSQIQLKVNAILKTDIESLWFDNVSCLTDTILTTDEETNFPTSTPTINPTTGVPTTTNPTTSIPTVQPTKIPTFDQDPTEGNVGNVQVEKPTGGLIITFIVFLFLGASVFFVIKAMNISLQSFESMFHNLGEGQISFAVDNP